jgi:16S rRNA (uracil1498-N3)-methyltransferase
MDYIVQKVVELGVSRIIPLETTHCVVKYDTAKQRTRRERWQKIAHEAAKQCGRAVIPTVSPVQPLAELLANVPEQMVVIMLYEGDARRSLKSILQHHPSVNYLLIVGPEGGFSSLEVSECKQHGAQIVTLGPRILRTETAGLAAVSAVMYEHGDLGEFAGLEDEVCHE